MQIQISPILSKSLVVVWFLNCILGILITIQQVWIPNMRAGQVPYGAIISDAFDGVLEPIAYIPDWSLSKYQNKSTRYEDVPISDFVRIPTYNPMKLADITDVSKESTLLHYTYTVPYLGGYNLDYKENAGSHPGVDIRAPIGTPVQTIANGVIVRVVDGDATGNKYIVVRHDNVPWNGKNTTLYSGYLHLSEISVTEGMKVRKGDMIGRVGMTGIATTPHLHLQIDTLDAPFHPYWPFTSSDSKAAGLSFFDSVSVGLGKEKAAQYTINPFHFIYGESLTYSRNTANITAASLNEKRQSATIASSVTPTTSYIPEDTTTPSCSKKRFNDVDASSALAKMLYPLVDNNCLFQENTTEFNPKSNVTKGYAIKILMDFYGVEPSKNMSHFIDIAIGDELQGYAQKAYNMGILTGNRAEMEKILTKEEFITLLVQIGKVPKNLSSIKIFADVDPMNPNYDSIQSYAMLAGIRGGRLYPNAILQKQTIAQILSNIKK